MARKFNRGRNAWVKDAHVDPAMKVLETEVRQNGGQVSSADFFWKHELVVVARNDD